MIEDLEPMDNAPCQPALAAQALQGPLTAQVGTTTHKASSQHSVEDCLALRVVPSEQALAAVPQECPAARQHGQTKPTGLRDATWTK